MIWNKLKITSRLVGLCLSVSGAKLTVSAIILSVFSGKLVMRQIMTNHCQRNFELSPIE